MIVKKPQLILQFQIPKPKCRWLLTSSQPLVFSLLIIRTPDCNQRKILIGQSTHIWTDSTVYENLNRFDIWLFKSSQQSSSIQKNPYRLEPKESIPAWTELKSLAAKVISPRESSFRKPEVDHRTVSISWRVLIIFFPNFIWLILVFHNGLYDHFLHTNNQHKCKTKMYRKRGRRAHKKDTRKVGEGETSLWKMCKKN